MLTSLLGCSSSSESTPHFTSLPALSSPSESSESVAKGVLLDKIKEFFHSVDWEVRGELEPCGCPTLPYGGFARRDRLLQELEQQKTVFHLDAGELLLKGFYSNKGEDAQKKLLISQLSKKVGVVWTVGPTDLMALDIQELQSIEGPPDSATWVDEKEEWLFDPLSFLKKTMFDWPSLDYQNPPLILPLSKKSIFLTQKKPLISFSL